MTGEDRLAQIFAGPFLVRVGNRPVPRLSSVREVIRTLRVRAWDDDGGLGTPPAQLAGIAFSDCVHARFRGKVWTKIRWCAASSTAGTIQTSRPLPALRI